MRRQTDGMMRVCREVLSDARFCTIFVICELLTQDEVVCFKARSTAGGSCSLVPKLCSGVEQWSILRILAAIKDPLSGRGMS